jgi:alanine dehydrogenase
VVVTEDLVQSMAPGSVIVDTAVDQGGCVASTRETTHHDPVFEHHGVLHYGVGNMPGAVPRTSTWALTNATLPYLRELARLGPERACAVDPVLASGRNVEAGAITNEAVAAALAAA